VKTFRTLLPCDDEIAFIKNLEFGKDIDPLVIQHAFSVAFGDYEDAVRLLRGNKDDPEAIKRLTKVYDVIKASEEIQRLNDNDKVNVNDESEYKLWKDVKQRFPIKPHETAINSICNHTLHRTVMCQGAPNKNRAQNNQTKLIVKFHGLDELKVHQKQPSVQILLNTGFEQRDDADAMYFGIPPELCKGDVSEVNYVSDLNDILILQLARFAGRAGNKIHDAVIMDDVIEIHDKETLKKYKLIAVIYHSGENPRAGHYYCDCLKGERWLRYDDDDVIHVIEPNGDNDNQKKCFVLFYRYMADHDAADPAWVNPLALAAAPLVAPVEVAGAEVAAEEPAAGPAAPTGPVAAAGQPSSGNVNILFLIEASLTMQYDEKTTILDVKKYILDQKGIPVEKMKIIIQGASKDDAENISSLVYPGDNIYCVINKDAPSPSPVAAVAAEQPNPSMAKNILFSDLDDTLYLKKHFEMSLDDFINSGILLNKDGTNANAIIGFTALPGHGKTKEGYQDIYRHLSSMNYDDAMSTYNLDPNTELISPHSFYIPNSLLQLLKDIHASPYVDLYIISAGDKRHIYTAILDIAGIPADSKLRKEDHQKYNIEPPHTKKSTIDGIITQNGNNGKYYFIDDTPKENREVNELNSEGKQIITTQIPNIEYSPETLLEFNEKYTVELAVLMGASLEANTFYDLAADVDPSKLVNFLRDNLFKRPEYIKFAEDRKDDLFTIGTRYTVVSDEIIGDIRRHLFDQLPQQPPAHYQPQAQPPQGPPVALEPTKAVFFDLDHTLVTKGRIVNVDSRGNVIPNGTVNKTDLNRFNGAFNGANSGGKGYKYLLDRSGYPRVFVVNTHIINLLRTLVSNNVDIYIVSAAQNKIALEWVLYLAGLPRTAIKNLCDGPCDYFNWKYGWGADGDKISKINTLIEESGKNYETTVFVDDSEAEIDTAKDTKHLLNNVNDTNVHKVADEMNIYTEQIVDGTLNTNSHPHKLINKRDITQILGILEIPLREDLPPQEFTVTEILRDITRDLRMKEEETNSFLGAGKTVRPPIGYTFTQRQKADAQSPEPVKTAQERLVALIEELERKTATKVMLEGLGEQDSGLDDRIAKINAEIARLTRQPAAPAAAYQPPAQGQPTALAAVGLYDAKIAQLMGMGYSDPNAVLAALTVANGDVNLAKDYLPEIVAPARGAAYQPPPARAPEGGPFYFHLISYKYWTGPKDISVNKPYSVTIKPGSITLVPVKKGSESFKFNIINSVEAKEPDDMRGTEIIKQYPQGKLTVNGKRTEDMMEHTYQFWMAFDKGGRDEFMEYFNRKLTRGGNKRRSTRRKNTTRRKINRRRSRKKNTTKRRFSKRRSTKKRYSRKK
jgi:hypothetical protein